MISIPEFVITNFFTYVLLPVLMSLTFTFSENLKKIPLLIYEKIQALWVKKRNSVTLETTVDTEEYGSDWKGFTMYSINAISYHLRTNEAFNKNFQYTINFVSKTVTDSSSYYKNYVIELFPTEEIEYEDIFYLFRKTVIGENRDKNEWKLEISSYKYNTKYISNFIKECTDRYTDIIHPPSNIVQHLFTYPNSGNISEVNKYRFFSKKTFENTFLKQKTQIINLLDQVKEGKLSKLGFLFYGIPGTGKTSLIKSIINYTKRHVVYINLNTVASMDHLMKILFSERIGDHTIPLSKRIYIFEDIDCNGNITNKRSVDTETSPGKEKEEKSFLFTLTMSNVLNCLDGIVELQGSIIIMTTNHKDKLDPALFRPGRINLSLELTNLDIETANEMIKYKYKMTFPHQEILRKVVDKGITPSTLENFMMLGENYSSLANEFSNFLNF